MLKNHRMLLKGNETAIISMVILVIAFGVGAIVRIQYISGIDYPVNDGGLFYRMTEDLLNNDLRMPSFTTYNNDGIPFAYPPLAFYLIAIIKLASGQSLLYLLRIIPLLVNILVIFAFYAFAKRLFNDRVKVALSVLVFALLPRTFEWFLMGGGVTRGLGFLFAVLALSLIWDLFAQEWKWTKYLGVVFFSSACVLSHPETSLFVIFIAGVLFAYHRIRWENIKKGVFVGLGVAICIAPWIISVYSSHGWDPFLVASETGHGDWLEIKNFLTLNFGFENHLFLPITSLFALLAVFIKKEKLTYTLSVSILLGYFLFPRSGPNLITILVSPLAAIGISEVLLISGAKDETEKSLVSILENDLKPKLILIFVMIYLVLGSFTFKYIIERDSIVMTDDLLNVYDWLEDNTDQEANIVFYPVAGADRFWWNDFAAEWFPALTTRTNLTTVQGSEWLTGEYQRRATDYLELRTCAEIGPVCVENWESKNQIRINYLVIGQINTRQDFVANFTLNPSYSQVFLGEEYIVFSRK